MMQTCFHCHDPLPAGFLPENLRLAEKSFCCEGCKMVYEILQTNHLCQYYELGEGAGNSLRTQRDARAYAWLDDPEIAARLCDFNDGQRAKIRFYLPGMHCAACIWLLEHLYRLDAGVLRSSVHFPEKTVSIDFSPEKTTLRRLAALLSRLGYPPEINLADTDGLGKKALDRSLLYQIGVAGFAFGNIMLLSFPEYLGLERETDPGFFRVFAYLNLLLALPVLLFSARDYLFSAWNGLKQGHLNIDLPLSLGILMLFARSAVEILSGTGAGYMDSFVGLVFFLLCGKWFQQKTLHRLSFERDYRSYFPVAASVRRGQEETATPLSKLVPGDKVLVRNGELIPADGVLLRGQGQVDYSFVTGEALPVRVAAGEKVFAGGKQVGDLLEISLTNTVSQSYLTQLWNDAAFKTPQKGHNSHLADLAGKWFTVLILGLGAGAFFYWWLLRGDLGTAFNAFTAVFMVACPCAIAISLPFTLGNVLRVLGRAGFFIKNTQVLEAFETVSAVVFDKTGTLTRVGAARPEDFSKTAPSSGTNFGQTNGVRFVPSLLNDEDGPVFEKNMHSTALAWALDASELKVVKSITYLSNHPASRRIFEALPLEIPVLPVEHFREETGQGVSGFVEGSFVQIGNRRGDPLWLPNPKLPPQSKLSPNPMWSPQSFLQIKNRVLGHFEFENQYRPGLKTVLAYFRTAFRRNPRAANNTKAQIFLLSGDNNREAEALTAFFPDREAMFFEQSPQQKLDFVKNLQRFGQKVLFFGDGLNDAGALRQSDVGIVVSENTNNFTPASDAILRASEFERLPQFFEFVRTSLRVVKFSFALALAYNLVGLSFAVTGALSPLVAAILMPLSSVTIVMVGVWGSDWAAWRAKITQDAGHVAGNRG